MNIEGYTRLIEAVHDPCRIINSTDFFHSGVLIPFFVRDGELRVLFERRATGIRQGGEVSFPGGAVESGIDRNSEDAALRETSEELGIPREEIRVDGKFGSFLNPSGILIDAYIGFLDVDDETDLPFSPIEVEELFSLPFSYFFENNPEVYTLRIEMQPAYTDPEGNEIVGLPARDLGLPQRYHQAWTGRPHSVYVYPSKPHVIWGITAKILVNLAERCRELGLAGKAVEPE
jgi:8-oxo-dGTP pyrophosphatase MutT (NUDIX family)